MLKILAHLIISMLAIWLTDYLIDGVHISGDWTNVLIVTLVLGVVNATIGTLLKVLTFPLSLLTFGLVSFLISGLMVLLADYFLKSFSVDNYWYGLLFAFVLSVIQWGFKSIFGMKK
ncbi:MAG: phage holin family protein [Candidatus Gracilibacteria bacterium]